MRSNQTPDRSIYSLPARVGCRQARQGFALEPKIRHSALIVVLLLLVATTGVTMSQENMFSDVKWIAVADSPFTVRVLDCRAAFGNLTAWTTDKAISESYLELRSSDGRQHIAHQPASAKTILSNLKYHHAGHAPEGKLFRSSKMDEKWDIYHYDDTLLLVRSWRDQLVYRATVQFSDDEVHVLSIQYDSVFVESDEMATRGVDFLIRSHLFDLVTPAPIPSRLREGAKEIAAYLWKQYGTMVYYGAHGDTTRLTSNIKLKRAQ
jgi:hypothetical protein